MTTKYYGNHECKVLFENETHALIQIYVDSTCVYGGSYDEPPEYEPVHTSIMVPKNMVMNEPVTIDSATTKALKIIKNAEKEAKDIVRNADYEKRALIQDAKTEVKEIKSLCQKFKDHGILQYLHYLEGRFEWFASIDSYNTGIYHINDLQDKDSYGCALKAISFRDKNQLKRNVGSLYVERYSDASGNSRFEVKGFSTRADAEAYLIDAVESGKIEPSRLCSKAMKYKITSPKIEAYKREKRENERVHTLKEIAKKREELEYLEKQIRE